MVSNCHIGANLPPAASAKTSGPIAVGSPEVVYPSRNWEAVVTRPSMQLSKPDVPVSGDRRRKTTKARIPPENKADRGRLRLSVQIDSGEPLNDGIDFRQRSRGRPRFRGCPWRPARRSRHLPQALTIHGEYRYIAPPGVQSSTRPVRLPPEHMRDPTHTDTDTPACPECQRWAWRRAFLGSRYSLDHTPLRQRWSCP